MTPRAVKYERRVEQMAEALHRDCVLNADARLALDPVHDPWDRDFHRAARHYGQAHDLVRRIWPKLDLAAHRGDTGMTTDDPTDDLPQIAARLAARQLAQRSDTPMATDDRLAALLHEAEQAMRSDGHRPRSERIKGLDLDTTCACCRPGDAMTTETVITEDPEEDGSMDDLFIKGGIESVHVERLDKHLWWAAVYLTDGSRVVLHWRAPSQKRVVARWEREETPA